MKVKIYAKNKPGIIVKGVCNATSKKDVKV